MSNYAYVATRARSRRSRLLPAEAYNQLLNLEHAGLPLLLFTDAEELIKEKIGKLLILKEKKLMQLAQLTMKES